MFAPDRYEAFWIPGLNDDDFDPDNALALGIEWLQTAEYPGRGVIVLNAVKMTGNRPLLAEAATSYDVVSPQSRNRVGPTGAVLAVWPDDGTLELAQRLALDAGLCVIPGTLHDVTPWIARTEAVNLVDPDATTPSLPLLEKDVRETIDSIVWFVGHKNIGGSEKVETVRRLQIMIRDGHRPDADDVVAYASGLGTLSAKSLRQLRDTYEGLLAGKQFRDYAGRTIR